MKLIDLLQNINKLNDDLTIYAVRDPVWREDSESVVCFEPEDGTISSEAEGMEYLLEVFLAKEVVDVWRKWRDGNDPSPKDICEAVIYYAKNDAYLPV